LAFAAVVNVALLGTFVWTELLSGWQWWLVWSTAVIAATGSLAHGDGPQPGRGTVAGRLVEPADDLFATAQQEYIRTHWVEAEVLLRRLLVKLPGDAAARLLLATLYRRTGRYKEAQHELRRIESLNDGDDWCWEIERERILLDDHATETTEEGFEETVEPPADTDFAADGEPHTDEDDREAEGYSGQHELGEAA
jgi:tetratricopeptide (TPR) repeat protein